MKSFRKRTSVFLAAFVWVCFALTPSPVQASSRRDFIMLGSSLIHLFFLSMIGWKAAGHDTRPAPESGPFLPNYNLSPDSEEAVLARKIADQIPGAPPSMGIRTLSHSYFEEILRRGSDARDSLAFDSFTRSALLHLEGQNEAARGRWGSPWLEPRARASYLFVHSPNRAVPRAAGSVNPLLQNREGRFSEEGHLGTAGAGVRGGVSSWLSYEVEPEGLFSSREAGIQEHASFYLHRGYLKGNIRNFEIELGKDTVQWGQGRYGSLLFSGENEAFYLVRFSNSLPVELPWFFRYLGPTRTDFFLGMMEDNREYPHSLLHGMKMTFQPHRRWELGLGQTIQFGGEGSGSWNPLNYFSEKLFTGDKAVNRNFIIETRWRIPRLEIEPYVEFYWEDCCRDVDILNPRDTLNVAGLYFPNMGAGGRVDFAAEWVRTNRITYRHGFYSSGFFYKGHVMGHPIGPDGSGVYGVLRYFHTPAFWGRMVAGFEQRGRQEGVVPEDRYRLSFDVHQQIAGRLRLVWETGYEHVIRFNFQKGDDRNNVIAGVSLEVF